MWPCLCCSPLALTHYSMSNTGIHLCVNAVHWRAQPAAQVLQKQQSIALKSSAATWVQRHQLPPLPAPKIHFGLKWRTEDESSLSTLHSIDAAAHLMSELLTQSRYWGRQKDWCSAWGERKRCWDSIQHSTAEVTPRHAAMTSSQWQDTALLHICFCSCSLNPPTLLF